MFDRLNLPTCKEARRRLGLSQDDLARIAGVSLQELAAYEAGTRRPMGRAASAINGMVMAFEGDTETFPDSRFGTYELPATRWVAVIRPDEVVWLPIRLDWSLSLATTEGRDLSSRETRASTYAQVLDEGLPSDIRFWVDPDALVDLWPDVPVARRLRPHVDTLVQRLRPEPSCAGAA